YLYVFFEIPSKECLIIPHKYGSKWCLNCQNYIPDDLDIQGEYLPKGTYASSGVCEVTDTRRRDGWACGEWTPKEAEE
ncbi:unnamed protein product, partial [marine sediment metagenome]